MKLSRREFELSNQSAVFGFQALVFGGIFIDVDTRDGSCGVGFGQAAISGGNAGRGEVEELGGLEVVYGAEESVKSSR